MKRFHSSYESLHRIRQQEARLAEMELGALVAELRQAQQRRDEARAEIEDASRQIASLPLGAITADRIQADQMFLFRLRGQLDESERAVEEQTVKVDQQTAHVVEKRAGVEVVQKLLDQQRRVHRQETLREQQVRLDELSAHRAARSQPRPQTLQGDPS